MQIYQSEPVIEHLERQGERLREGANDVIRRHGLEAYVEVFGQLVLPAAMPRATRTKPSQPMRTLFLQETIRRGVLMPSLVVSYSHTATRTSIARSRRSTARSVSIARH